MSMLTWWLSRTHCEGYGRSGPCALLKLPMCHNLLYVLKRGKGLKRGISNGELVLYSIRWSSAGSSLGVRGWWHIWGYMWTICHSITWLICLNFRGKQILPRGTILWYPIWCRSSMLDEDTCFRALRSLHRLLTRCLDTTQISARISMYIEQTDGDHAREIFIRIVRRLILLSYVSFCSLLSPMICIWMISNFKDVAPRSLIHFSRSVIKIVNLRAVHLTQTPLYILFIAFSQPQGLTRLFVIGWLKGTLPDF